MPLSHTAGHMPVLGFGTLIPGAAATISATRDALEAGFRHFDCAERYRNEREVGEALQAGLAAGRIAREDIFVTTKLWNSNHRPERVKPAFEQDPRDQHGNIIYDRGVTLPETWGAMESLVDSGRCRAIGLSDIGLNELLPVYESARIKPAVVQVEAHPYLPETELLEFRRQKGIVFLAFAPLGHGIRPAARRSGHLRNCRTSWKDAGTSTVGLGGAAWHCLADYSQNRGPRAGELQHLRPSGRRV
jgi:alcohol dehydrogenase (NADP+)